MTPPASERTENHSNNNNAVVVTVTANEAPVEPHKERTYIARLIVRMSHCLEQLGVHVAEGDSALLAKIESMSILIHESMSISSRNYHSVQHVFDISKDLTDPLAILAAFFHDCVYYHVDGGLSEMQAKKLHGVLVTSQQQDEEGVLRLTSHPENDELLHMLMTIYGYEANQVVTPMMGLNEFLSAVIAVRELEPILSVRNLAEIAACIEATIPFRPTCPEKGTCTDQLFVKLKRANQVFELGMTQAELVTAVQRAVIMANEDVGNFGTDDLAWFLDNTWSLLPESNAALRHQYLYTVYEFQFAVFKMNGFFSFLKPNVIFQQFRAVPTDDELEPLVAHATRNLEAGRKYVGAKLLSTSVLAAFAALTGGDAPMSLFVGDLPGRHRRSYHLEESISPPTALPETCDPDVYRLLVEGRRRETSFDVRKSPLAAYFYAYLGDDGLFSILAQQANKLYPMTPEHGRQLLGMVPRNVVTTIADKLSQIALSRRELIQECMEHLNKDSTCV